MPAPQLDDPAGLDVGQDARVVAVNNRRLREKFAAGIDGSNIANGSITNAHVAAAAALAYSKLNLLAAIVNADIAAGAAIAYSKLALGNSIVNADIASAAAIAVSKLAAGGTNGMIFKTVAGVPTWTKEGPQFESASPPSSPVDNQLWLYDAGSGVNWLFRYNASSGSAHKWEFVGGAPLRDEVLTNESTTSTTYTDLTTTGPTLVVPFAGDYDVFHVCTLKNSGANESFVSVKVGAATAADDDGAQTAGTNFFMGMTSFRASGVSASATLKQQYRVSAGTGNFLRRRLVIYPVRVS